MCRILSTALSEKTAVLYNNWSFKQSSFFLTVRFDLHKSTSYIESDWSKLTSQTGQTGQTGTCEVWSIRWQNKAETSEMLYLRKHFHTGIDSQHHLLFERRHGDLFLCQHTHKNLKFLFYSGLLKVWNSSLWHIWETKLCRLNIFHSNIYKNEKDLLFYKKNSAI